MYPEFKVKNEIDMIRAAQLLERHLAEKIDADNIRASNWKNAVISNLEQALLGFAPDWKNQYNAWKEED